MSLQLEGSELSLGWCSMVSVLLWWTCIQTSHLNVFSKRMTLQRGLATYEGQHALEVLK